LNIFGFNISRKSQQKGAKPEEFISLRDARRLIGQHSSTLSASDNTYVSKGYATNADLFAVINRMAQAAKIPTFTVYVEKAGKWQPVEGTKINKLIEQPQTGVPWSQWVEAYIAYRCMVGNAIYYAPTPEGFPDGYITELFTIAPQYVDVQPQPNATPFSDNGLLQYNVQAGTWSMNFTDKDCIHFRNFSPFQDEWYWGMSPIRAGLEVLSRSNQAQRAANKAFTNMGAYGMLSGATNETMLGDDVIKNLDKDYRRVFGGSDNTKKVIITPKMVEWTNFGMSPVDLQIIENMKMDLRQFCNLYGVPTQLMNDDKASTFNNMSTAVKMLYTDAVFPLLNDLKDMFNTRICPAFSRIDGRKYWVEYDIYKIPSFAEERKEMEKELRENVRAGILTPNEAREELNRPAKEGGDALIVQPRRTGSN
jgi:HK97 family phage portal protein